MEGCMSSLNGNGAESLCEGLTQLKREHIPLLEKLHGLNHLCSKIDQNEDAEENFSKLTPAVEIFMAELGPHSEREEQVLFRMMETYLGVGMGPVAVMEYEHEQAKSLIGRFLENSSSQSEPLSLAQMKEDSSLVKNAYLTLVDHFSKEENVLFPMAERMLTNEEKSELFEKINQI